MVNVEFGAVSYRALRVEFCNVAEFVSTTQPAIPYPQPVALLVPYLAHRHDITTREAHIGEDRIIGISGNVPFEDMTDDEIDTCLLQVDVGARFDGDIEFLNLARDAARTERDAKRMRELLRHSGVPIGFTLHDD